MAHKANDVELVADLLAEETKKTSRKGGTKIRMGFREIELEFSKSPHTILLGVADADSIIGLGDLAAYKLGNAIASNPNVRFFLLVGLAVVLCNVLSLMWSSFTKYNGGAHEATSDVGGAFFMMLQVLLTGGYEDNIEHFNQRVLFAIAVMVGITLVSVLIGIITDTVNGYMDELVTGSTKVVESGHTLILGWNESTTRALVQIAFLRRVFHSQNDTWLRRLLPFLRVEPSSPVAAAPIVVMTSTKSKKVMEETVKSAFAARSVGRRHTRVGHDIVFRNGDPTDTHDLVRVAAHKATSVLVMMTEVDREESEDSGGSTSNSATIRTVLALRNIIYSNGLDPALNFNPHLRVVVHLSEPCKFLSAASFVAPNTNRSVLYAQDLSRNINSLMFYCASKPGLSRVLMALYDFDDDAFRCRPVSELRAGNDGLLSCGKVGWFAGKTMAQAKSDHGWENAVVVGCGQREIRAVADGSTAELTRRLEAEYEAADHCDGLVNDPNRKITKDDFIIFISKTSSPSMARAGDHRHWGALARPFVSATLRKLRVSQTNDDDAAPVKTKNILVCGWRPEWDSDPKRFCDRVQDIGHGLTPGCSITCVNIKEPQDFDSLLEKTPGPGFSKVKSPIQIQDFLKQEAPEGGERLNPSKWRLNAPGSPQFLVRHYSADPTDYDGVAPLLESTYFDTAICLGSVVGKNLSPGPRDSRVLSMLLVLRSLAKPGQGMHVIAENQQDQTSGLAVCPPTNDTNDDAAHEPDFINTQAIIARSLVLNLAYPQMQEALGELLSHDLENSPQVEFLTPQSLSINNKKVYFGVVQRIILELYKSRAQCIGFFEGAKLLLDARPGLKQTWTSKHRIIVIVRGGLEIDHSSSSSDDISTSSRGLRSTSLDREVGHRSIGNPLSTT